MTNRALNRIAAISILYALSTVELLCADHLPMRLVGTVRGPEGGIAICLDRALGQTFSLKIGERFRGWVLREVRGENAIFEQTGSSARAVVTIESSATGVALASPVLPHVPAAAGPQASPGQAPQASSAPPKGKWVDGDGQVIDPPKR
jgi:hypothetical protein